MAFVQSVVKVTFTGATGASAVTITAGANFNPANLVVVGVEFFAATSTDISGVTVAGTAASAIKQGNTGATNQADIWAANTNAGGSAAAVISFGTGGHDGFAGLLEWSNANGTDSGTPNGVVQTASLAPTVSTAATTSQADTLLFGSSASTAASTNTYTQPSGWTDLGTESNGATNNSGAIGYFEDTGAAGTKTATWAQTVNSTTTNVIAAFKLLAPVTPTVNWVPGSVRRRGKNKTPKNLYSPGGWFGASAVDPRAAFFKHLVAPSGGVTTINAIPGTWSWSGTTATIPTQLSAAPGTWSWAGSVATTNQVINAIAAAWSWAGTAATFSQLVNQTAGAWSWAGTTASLTQLVNATPGTWSWAGSSATTTQLLNAIPGTWSWAGTTASFGGGVTNLDAIPGTWSWSGTTASSTQLLNAIPGAWSWAGTTATTNQVINSTPGTYTWAGTTASTNQAINATPGTWSWSGSVAGIVQAAAIDAVPSTFTWSGTTAVVTLPSDPLQDQIDELTRQLAAAKKLARGGWVKRHEPHQHDPTKNNQIIMALVGAVVHGLKGPKE